MRARPVGVAALGFFLGVGLAACSRPNSRTASVLDTPSTDVRAASRTPRAPSAVAPAGPVTRSEVERDLSLVMVRGSGPVEIGHEADTKILLVNRSTSRSYPVVLSGDGSDEPGWREPHVWYTLEQRIGSGAWKPAEYRAKRICGNFAENWEKDIVEVGPGKSVELPWFEFHPGFWVLDDEATALRVIAHYSFGEHVKDASEVSPALRRMPPYVLASAPLVLALDKPLVLELRLLGPIPRGPGQPIFPVFDVVAINQWKGPLPFSALDAGGAELSFQMEYEEKPGRVERAYFSTKPGDSHEAKGRIARGERRAVVTPSTRTDEDWELSRRTRVRRVRAVLSVHEYSSRRSVFSPWVDVPAR